MIWPWNLPKRKESLCWKTLLHILFVATLFVLAISHEQPNIVNRSIGKQMVVPSHTRISHNNIKEQGPEAETWTDLKTIVLGERIWTK